MEDKNIIKIATISNGAELSISAPFTKQVITATNNRAQYFAEMAKKYRDEAKTHMDNAKYYAEQNSDVTFEQIEVVRATLEDLIATKQDVGDYALKSEIPLKVSELQNDSNYINEEVFNDEINNINSVKLPNTLKKNQITNCILEAPRNINLELNNGTLTLKAGSKVLVPNGTNVFEEVITTKDLIKEHTTAGSYFICYDATLQALRIRLISESYSGATAPTSSTNAYWYDTANNRIGVSGNKGVTWTYNQSFPICIVTTNGTSIISIDEIFNHCGYIGQAGNISYWTGKGIKILAPWGRNIDGSLNNKEFISTTVKVKQYTAIATGRGNLVMDSAGGISANSYIEVDEIPTSSIGLFVLYRPENRVYQWNGTVYALKSTGVVPLADIKVQDGNFASWKNREAFRAVDVGQLNRDLDEINTDITSLNTKFSKSYIIQTYKNGNSGYRIWSDGFKEQWGRSSISNSLATQTVTFLKAFSDATFSIQAQAISSGCFANMDEESGVHILSVTKSNVVFESTWASNATSKIIIWYACGY